MSYVHILNSYTIGSQMVKPKKPPKTDQSNDIFKNVLWLVAIIGQNSAILLLLTIYVKRVLITDGSDSLNTPKLKFCECISAN